MTDIAERMKMAIIKSMGDYTEEQLHAAFDKVANKDNWKFPVDAVISRNDLDVTAKAVEFFTGSKLKIAEDLGANLRVQAIGYYAAVGA